MLSPVKSTALQKQSCLSIWKQILETCRSIGVLQEHSDVRPLLCHACILVQQMGAPGSSQSQTNTQLCSMQCAIRGQNMVLISILLPPFCVFGAESHRILRLRARSYLERRKCFEHETVPGPGRMPSHEAHSSMRRPAWAPGWGQLYVPIFSKFPECRLLCAAVA